MPNNSLSPLTTRPPRVWHSANKKFFLLFFLCFSLPFVAAKLALEFSWFHSGLGNKGEWFEREVDILPAARKHWQLVYIQGTRCEAHCEFALYMMQQIAIGLGRQQEQLNVLVMADQVPSQLQDFSVVQWQPRTVPLINLQNHIVIVNQLGMGLLHYAVVPDQKQMLETGRRIRADLRRLMAYDRGGY